jgi:hypothetical protein
VQPYDFQGAREAAAAASRAQLHAEKALKDAAREYAEKEERYRVARLRRERDIAEGVREAMQQACWRRAADRKDTQRFIDWSMRREMAEGYGSAPEPEFTEPIGAR